MTNLDANEDLLGKARLADVAGLLGAPRTRFEECHEILLRHMRCFLRGLPTKALTYLVDNFVTLRWDELLAKAIGMSLRTYQRHTAAAAKQLNPEQSGRTWKLAEILARATAVFGSKENAEQWLEQPATGLNQRSPSRPAGDACRCRIGRGIFRFWSKMALMHDFGRRILGAPGWRRLDREEHVKKLEQWRGGVSRRRPLEQQGRSGSVLFGGSSLRHT